MICHVRNFFSVIFPVPGGMLSPSKARTATSPNVWKTCKIRALSKTPAAIMDLILLTLAHLRSACFRGRTAEGETPSMRYPTASCFPGSLYIAVRNAHGDHWVVQRQLQPVSIQPAILPCEVRTVITGSGSGSRSSPMKNPFWAEPSLVRATRLQGRLDRFGDRRNHGTGVRLPP